MSISTVNVNVFCPHECRFEGLLIRRTIGCWYVKRVCVYGWGRGVVASVPLFYSRVNGTGESHPSASRFLSGPLSGHWNIPLIYICQHQEIKVKGSMHHVPQRQRGKESVQDQSAEKAGHLYGDVIDALCNLTFIQTFWNCNFKMKYTVHM